MVKHLIIWKLKEEFSAQEKAERCAKIKANLEALNGKIDGLEELKVRTDFLDSSNSDVFLDSLFRDEEALKAYITHPEHIKAGKIVRESVCSRSCVDFEI